MNEDLIKVYERPEAEVMAEWNKSVNEIQDILLSKFNLDNSDEDLVLHDIRHVKDFIKSKNW